MAKRLKPPEVGGKFGAPMGRRNVLPEDKYAKGKLHLVRLDWVDGDYDAGGAYWGYNGCNHVYWAYGDLDEVHAMIFIRGMTRAEAKVTIRSFLPNVTFYR